GCEGARKQRRTQVLGAPHLPAFGRCGSFDGHDACNASAPGAEIKCRNLDESWSLCRASASRWTAKPGSLDTPNPVRLCPEPGCLPMACSSAAMITWDFTPTVLSGNFGRTLLVV